MRGLRCARSRRLLDRRRAGLDRAEALRLEEHLAECSRCRDEARLLDGVAELADAEASRAARPARHARAITRVLNASSEAEISAYPGSPRLVPYAFAAALAVTAVAGVTAYRAGWGGEGDRPGPAASERDPALLPREAGPPPPARGPARKDDEGAARDSLTSGDLRAEGAEIEPGDPVTANAELETDAGAEVSLAAAEIELEPASRVSWEPSERALHLSQGAVVAEVESGADREPDERFRVVSDGFVVLVSGTRFEVSRERVVVEEGAVRVESPGGDVLAERLEAGDSWRRSAAAAEGEPREEEPRAGAGAGERKARGDSEGAREAIDVTQALTEARSLLARDEPERALSLLEEAFSRELSRVERAEAETLEAEAALVAGDRGRAVARYLEVARGYPHLSAGENALFAAARLEEERGRDERAMSLFSEYLERYEDGRFRDDAARRAGGAEAP